MKLNQAQLSALRPLRGELAEVVYEQGCLPAIKGAMGRVALKLKRDDVKLTELERECTEIALRHLLRSEFYADDARAALDEFTKIERTVLQLGMSSDLGAERWLMGDDERLVARRLVKAGLMMRGDAPTGQVFYATLQEGVERLEALRELMGARL